LNDSKEKRKILKKTNKRKKSKEKGREVISAQLTSWELKAI
jgi:hypothetical protein